MASNRKGQKLNEIFGYSFLQNSAWVFMYNEVIYYIGDYAFGNLLKHTNNNETLKIEILDRAKTL
jgi:hypothetical protein